jgi:hypothetical protein
MAMTQQDSAYALMEAFQENIQTLHHALGATQPIIENLKKVLALQWFLGNLTLALVFACGLFAYFFARKALLALNPTYKLPRRWLVGYCALAVVAAVAFNVLPLGINLQGNSHVETARAK